MTLPPALAMLLAAAAAPATSLTAAQQHALDKAFICPDRLPDDATRIAAMDRFIARYAAFAPRSRIGERMAFYDHLRAKHECPDTDQRLNHTVPEV